MRTVLFVFGYVRPYKPEMLIKEYDLYKCAYCSLCKHLGRNFGIFSRLTLSYDATFLAMLHMALKEECPGFQKGRCVVNPAKKCAYCTGGEESFLFAGAVSVLMTHNKLKDDIQDSGILGKLRAYLLVPFSTPAYRKAKRDYPALDQIISQYMDKQMELEQDPEAGIDSSADPTAQMLSKLFALLSDGHDKQAFILGQLGYFLGRWIYLMDAADDIQKDQKRQQYNPFVKKLILDRKDAPMSWKEIADYCNGVLNQTLSQALNAFHLLDLQHFDTILDNILNLGMPAMQKQILFDKEIEHV